VSAPRVSVVVPAYQEGEAVQAWLQRITEGVTLPFELLVVVDSADDSTAPFVERFSAGDPRVRLLVNTPSGTASTSRPHRWWW
jgi:glycosyltransferase involved in cell wall biosynthesis